MYRVEFYGLYKRLVISLGSMSHFFPPAWRWWCLGSRWRRSCGSSFPRWLSRQRRTWRCSSTSLAPCTTFATARSVTIISVPNPPRTVLITVILITVPSQMLSRARHIMVICPLTRVLMPGGGAGRHSDLARGYVGSKRLGAAPRVLTNVIFPTSPRAPRLLRRWTIGVGGGVVDVTCPADVTHTHTHTQRRPIVGGVIHWGHTVWTGTLLVRRVSKGVIRRPPSEVENGGSA